jgi:hypothetical protein
MKYKYRFDDNAILKNRRHFNIYSFYINKNLNMCDNGFWKQQKLSNIIDMHKKDEMRSTRFNVPLREDLKANCIFLDFEVARFYEV